LITDKCQDCPLVSTIIPVYNRASLLLDSVESVIRQTYGHVEIILVNDGSTDETPNVLLDLSIRWPDIVRVVHQANSGPGPARQRGLDLAKGEFVQFLDSDDLLLPEKFSYQVAALVANPEAQICYGRSYEENYSRQPLRREGPMRQTGRFHRHLFPLLLVERWWTTSSPLYRRSLLERIGPWRSLLNEEDWEYDARAGANGAQLCWVDEDVSVRRIHLAPEHLSTGGTEDPRKLLDRAKARQSIYLSALAAGIDTRKPEMAHFARSAFLLSRQCGLAGLDVASKDLFVLARRASTPARRLGPDYLLYGLLGYLLGWSNTARLILPCYRMLSLRRGS
jgi:glycosyltransferase involved in cell wall biosynthesis